MEPRQPSATDLSDKAWELITQLVPEAKPGGRPEHYPKREILNGLFSLVRGGCAWRLMPHDLPPWPIVDQDCWRWRQDSTWPRRHDLLRGDVRVATGKRRQPSAGMIESQSGKTTDTGGSAALMSTNRSKAASGISSSTRADASWPSWSPRRVYTSVLGPKPC